MSRGHRFNLQELWKSAPRKETKKIRRVGVITKIKTQNLMFGLNFWLPAGQWAPRTVDTVSWCYRYWKIKIANLEHRRGRGRNLCCILATGASPHFALCPDKTSEADFFTSYWACLHLLPWNTFKPSFSGELNTSQWVHMFSINYKTLH